MSSRRMITGNGNRFEKAPWPGFEPGTARVTAAHTIPAQGAVSLCNRAILPGLRAFLMYAPLFKFRLSLGVFHVSEEVLDAHHLEGYSPSLGELHWDALVRLVSGFQQRCLPQAS
jgi:hypothetical protein